VWLRDAFVRLFRRLRRDDKFLSRLLMLRDGDVLLVLLRGEHRRGNEGAVTGGGGGSEAHVFLLSWAVVCV